MIHDTTGPIAIQAFEEYGKERVWDPSKMVVVLDHATQSQRADQQPSRTSQELCIGPGDTTF
jgi:homoaconitase/3-isopropylmalate dehydratase large subunit